jgi:CubicO group peptidase (beta-lactamase class C family)
MGHRWWFGIPFPATVPYNRSNLPAGFAICSAEDMAHFLMAQMNNGRYQDRSILSPEKMALLHTEPAPKTYGLGWESVRIDGRRLIYHDGGNANFQASVFFDPEARVGVFIAANVFSALDAFSSNHGVSSLDGPTARSMAESVLSLAVNQPLPKQGIGNLWLYAIYDLVLLGLTGALIRSLARIPGRYQRLAQRGIADRSGLAQQTGLAAVLHFAVPASLLYFALKVPNWILFVLFLPDLVYWLETVALVLSLKGVLEIALIWRVFRHTHQRQILQRV